MYLFAYLFLLFFYSLSEASIIIDLGGKNVWSFYSLSNQSLSNRQFAFNVPGDIFTDLEYNGILKKSPLFDTNDLNYRWVAYEDWVYERNFTIPNYLLKVYLNNLYSLKKLIFNIPYCN